MDDLNKRVINLEIKTKILESDKTWEKSILKRIIELAFIYITSFLFLSLTGANSPSSVVLWSNW